MQGSYVYQGCSHLAVHRWVDSLSSSGQCPLVTLNHPAVQSGPRRPRMRPPPLRHPANFQPPIHRLYMYIYIYTYIHHAGVRAATSRCFNFFHPPLSLPPSYLPYLASYISVYLLYLLASSSYMCLHLCFSPSVFRLTVSRIHRSSRCCRARLIRGEVTLGRCTLPRDCCRARRTPVPAVAHGQVDRPAEGSLRGGRQKSLGLINNALPRARGRGKPSCGTMKVLKIPGSIDIIGERRSRQIL